MNHNAATAQIMELIKQTNSPASFTVGELTEEIRRRLEPGEALRITPKSSTFSSSQYINNLHSADAINEAFKNKRWVKEA